VPVTICIHPLMYVKPWSREAVSGTLTVLTRYFYSCVINEKTSLWKQSHVWIQSRQRCVKTGRRGCAKLSVSRDVCFCIAVVHSGIWLAFIYHVPDPPSGVSKMSSDLPIHSTLTQSEMAGSVYDFCNFDQTQINNNFLENITVSAK
jgi:hypothetical protein